MPIYFADYTNLHQNMLEADLRLFPDNTDLYVVASPTCMVPPHHVYESFSSRAAIYACDSRGDCFMFARIPTGITTNHRSASRL